MDAPSRTGTTVRWGQEGLLTHGRVEFALANDTCSPRHLPALQYARGAVCVCVVGVIAHLHEILKHARLGPVSALGLVLPVPPLIKN